MEKSVFSTFAYNDNLTITGSERNGNPYHINSVHSFEQHSTKSSPSDSNREKITPDKLPDDLGLKEVGI